MSMDMNLYLYASVAETRVAIPADQVEAVVRLGEIVPVQCVPAYVRGLAALRSRVLTVIDMQARVSGERTRLDARPLAVVADVGGHAYGLIVTAVSDIAPAPDGRAPLLGRIEDDWTPYADSIIVHNGESHLLLSVEDFIAVGTGSAARAA